MLFLILLIVFLMVALVGYSIVPSAYSRFSVVSEQRQHKISSDIEHLLPRKQAVNLSRLFVFAPFILGVLFYFISPPQMAIVGAVVGFSLGFIIPSFYLKFLTNKIQKKFNTQLIDALMIMSSSFRGGLSLVQALEAVVEEMPDPIKKEFAIVLGENKMGASLEEALQHLYKRMPSSAVQQMTTAILLARETGGNLPVIFNRIVTNIRETRKVQQNLDTLTLQGKIQGVVMTLLPIAFGFVVYNTNKRIFVNMLESQLGKTLLIYAFISWLIGAFMVWKLSQFKDF